MFVVVVILIGGFIIFKHDLKPTTIKSIAEAEARWVATDAINRAIKSKIASVDLTS